ncbi:MAG: endonuclease, partial [Campylobacterales bacterium]|nr:endonuclease [Campylobacterales bacterium]
VTQAILSKYPFLYSKEISITQSPQFRNIQEIKFKIDNEIFYLFNNHWKAKSGPESMRIRSAKVLKNRIDEIGRDKNIILVGDFNSDYEEYIKFQRSKKLNDTNGYTGINHILSTIKQTDKASKVKYDEEALYNLWYDEDAEDRYTLIYKGRKDALDNIIVSQPLLKKDGMFYKENSLHSVKFDYLFYKKKYIYNWKMTKDRVRKHKGKGFSDHLPLTAKFIIKST